MYASVTAYTCYLAVRGARLSFRRAVIQATAAGALTTLGQFSADYQRVDAHITFYESLENPQGYFRAIANVQRRLGGSLPKRPEEFIIKRRDDKHRSFPTTTSADAEDQNDEDWTYSSDKESSSRPSPEPSYTRTTSSLNRWDQIRQEAARSKARNSSWDAVRQSHERKKLPPNIPAKEQVRIDTSLEDEH
jgi:hypothetical protein